MVLGSYLHKVVLNALSKAQNPRAVSCCFFPSFQDLSTSFPLCVIFFVFLIVCHPIHSTYPISLSPSFCLSHLFFIQSQIVRFAKWDLILELSDRRLIPINLQKAGERDGTGAGSRRESTGMLIHSISSGSKWMLKTQSRSHVIYLSWNIGEKNSLVKDGRVHEKSDFNILIM